MKIIIQENEGCGFTLYVPLRLLGTRLGSLLAAGMLNSQRTADAPAALPSAEEEQAPAVTLSTAAQPDAPVTAQQLRALGRSLRTSAATLRASGLPLLELRTGDGSLLRIEL